MSCCICGGRFWHVEVLRENLLYLIFVPLLFLGCMSYIISSIPLLVLCTSILLHMVTMMLYGMADYVLLSLFLVGKRVCGCNLILQKCGCRLIGDEEFFILLENLDLLYLAIVICPTIEGGTLYLRCIVPL